MPIYIYKHPEEEEYIEVVQGMNDDHVYFDKDGLEWKRQWSLPQVSSEGGDINPFDNTAFIDKTGKMKGGGVVTVRNSADIWVFFNCVIGRPPHY